jgi:hypothetical protein
LTALSLPYRIPRKNRRWKNNTAYVWPPVRHYIIGRHRVV